MRMTINHLQWTENFLFRKASSNAIHTHTPYTRSEKCRSRRQLLLLLLVNFYCFCPHDSISDELLNYGLPTAQRDTHNRYLFVCACTSSNEFIALCFLFSGCTAPNGSMTLRSGLFRSTPDYFFLPNWLIIRYDHNHSKSISLSALLWKSQFSGMKGEWDEG